MYTGSGTAAKTLPPLTAAAATTFFFLRKTGIEFYIKVLVVTAQILQAHL
jgi:hypothetical protein